MVMKAIHGAASFSAIGYDFQSLERQSSVITADMPDAWFDPSPKAVEKIRGSLPFLLKTSPPTDAEGLLSVLSRVRGVPQECLLAGSGSSDLIFNCLPYLIRPGETAMVIDPLYGEYRHICEKVLGAEVETFFAKREDGFQVNVAALQEALRKVSPRLVFVVNPCNPTGSVVPGDGLRQVIESLPAGTSIFIDETYLEFMNERRSFEAEAASRRDVFVLKSMSKVYGLSGVRAGYIVAHKDWIEKFSKTVPPWAVGLIAQVAAVEALLDPGYYEKRYEETRSMREEMMQVLEIKGRSRCLASHANFFLLELLGSTPSSTEIARRLREENIYVRDCSTISSQFGDRFLRIAVKQPEHNRKLCGRISQLLTSAQHLD